jgi:hypothetical protein
MATRRSTFQRGGKGVFTCSCCGRSTRTVDQNDSDCCPQCYELSSFENQVQDGDMGSDDWSTVESYVAEAVSKGGDRAKLEASFDILFDARPADLVPAAAPAPARKGRRALLVIKHRKNGTVVAKFKGRVVFRGKSLVDVEFFRKGFYGEEG